MKTETLDVSFPSPIHALGDRLQRESSDAAHEGVGSRFRGNDTGLALELRAIAVLLDYPSEYAQQHIGEIIDALSAETRRAAMPLLRTLADGDLITLQETYLDTFDRGRRTALNLFEHVHGDSRDRGQAMVDLLSMYEKAGIHYTGDQLPDYLPVFLDFLATLPAAQAQEQLAEVTHILQSIAAALSRRGSDYLPLLQALLAFAGEDAGMSEDSEDPVEDDTSFEAIDAAYAEAPVNFLDANLQTACTPQTRPSIQTIQLHRRAA